MIQAENKLSAVLQTYSHTFQSHVCENTAVHVYHQVSNFQVKHLIKAYLKIYSIPTSYFLHGAVSLNVFVVL